MKPIKDWENVVPSNNRAPLQPGGYVIKIQGAVDDPHKEYLKIVYDIAEGDEAGRFSGEWGLNPDNEYAHRFYRSYTEKAKGMFKQFTQAVEKSNPQYTWDWKEERLVGKRLGVVLAEEEYENNRGEVKTRLYVAGVYTADEIRKGDFKVPALKKLKNQSEFSKAVSGSSSAPEGFEPLTDDDIPF